MTDFYPYLYGRETKTKKERTDFDQSVRPKIKTSSTAGNLIRLCCHDEIVAVQTFDLVCPPLDGDPAPLGNDQRVMSLLFGDGGDLVGQRNGFDKILKLEDTFQTFLAVHFLDL